jgi:hypothetical protein
MQRHSVRRLYAWLVSLHLAAGIRISAQGKMTGTSASPTLIFTSTALFLVLAILEIDQHRDEGRWVLLAATRA